MLYVYVNINNEIFSYSLHFYNFLFATKLNFLKIMFAETNIIQYKYLENERNLVK